MTDRNQEARTELKMKKARIAQQQDTIDRNNYMLKDIERQIRFNNAIIPIWEKQISIIRDLTFYSKDPRNALEASEAYADTLKEETLLNLSTKIDQAQINITEAFRKFNQIQEQNKQVEEDIDFIKHGANFREVLKEKYPTEIGDVTEIN